MFAQDSDAVIPRLLWRGGLEGAAWTEKRGDLSAVSGDISLCPRLRRRDPLPSALPQK